VKNQIIIERMMNKPVGFLENPFIAIDIGFIRIIQVIGS
jgi:hypothetical protein